MLSDSVRKRLGWFVERLLLFITLAFLPLAVVAQNPRGTLRGVVQDSNGGRVPAAKIIVQASESSLQREVTSDSRGEFRIDDLLPGAYRVRVQANGFAEASAEVIVRISSVQE